MVLEVKEDIKLLVITSSFPRFVGDPAGNFVYELARELVGKGMKILVIAPLSCVHQPPQFAVLNGLEVYRFRHFFPVRYQKLCHGGGFVYKLKVSNLAKIQLPLYILAQLLSAIKLTLSRKVDVVHTHWIVPQGFIGAIIYKFFKKPHILTVHAADVFTLKKIPFGKFFARFIVMNSTKIFVVSNYVSRSLCSMLPESAISEYNNKLKILPMGVNTEIYRKTPDLEERTCSSEEKFIILFIGRLSEKKGVIHLLEAMVELKSFSERIRLIICGDGPLRQDLEELAKQHELNEIVEFKGFISDTQKIEYLAMADALVVPSIIMDSGETEGLPVVILEGLAAGKVVVASNVSGASDAIQNGCNGFLVEQKKPEQIAEKIMFIMNYPEIRENIETNALNSSQKYDWSNISHQYEVAIKEALNVAD